MRTLDIAAQEIAETIDRRWGLDSQKGLVPYLRAVLRDESRSIIRDLVIPPGQDEVAILARFMARNQTLDYDNPEVELSMRIKAVEIIDVLETAGLTLASLSALYMRE